MNKIKLNMKMRDNTFRRVLFPVGQGGFYCERHFYNNEIFNVVYDCGSLSLKGKKFESLVKDAFLESEQIDVLFISHFDADHVNGIQYLKDHFKIKVVVIPIVSDKIIILNKINNIINKNPKGLELISNPEGFFRDDTIIVRIKEQEGDTTVETQINTETALSFDEITKNESFNSGTPFILSKKIKTWYYIPFNYKQNDRKTLFINKLPKTIDKKKLDDIDYIKENEAVIKNAYNSIEGKLNGNSLVLFSGNEERNIYVKLIYDLDYCKYHRWYKINHSCIYTGDADLTNKGFLLDLKYRLYGFRESIGSIQIPHHGSKHNINKEIIDNLKINRNLFFFVSYGTKNPYGHPSLRILEELQADTLNNESIILHITENKNTISKFYVYSANGLK